MRLVSLKIYKKINNELIREVKFNETGLSLICDDDGDIDHFSGSSIGKTAFARCIDICLGASSTKSIYYNKATGTDEALKEYIFSNQISLQLKVKDIKENTILLERHLFDNKEFVDGVLYNNYLDYCKAISNYFFPLLPENLSFRKIIPKFIRLESDDALKYLGSYGGNTDYFYAYYYLLNLYFNNNESNLIIEKESALKRISSLEKKYKIKNDNDFSNLQEEKFNYLNLMRNKIINNDYIGQYGNQDEKNSELIFELDDVTDKLNSKQYRLKVIEKNISKEESRYVEIDNEVLKQLYGDSIDVFGSSLRDYDEFVKFHNEMCMLRKQGYIDEANQLNKEISELQKEVTKLRENFNHKFVDYKTVVNDSSGSIYDNYYVVKMEYENFLSEKKEYEKLKERIKEINELLKSIEMKKNTNEDNKTRFNEIFKDKCMSFLKMDASLSYENTPTKMPISVRDIGGNLGTGDNKALICALDFALYEYFIEKSLNRPYFVVHDKMENVSLTELEEIFADARKSGIQYILPILHDRIDSLKVKDQEIILRLSKKNKLFKF